MKSFLTQFFGTLLLCASTTYALNATNIVVTSGADSGPGTLRAAITTLNGSPGPHNITFAPGLTTLTFTSDYPQIVRQMTIDGGASKVIIQTTAGDGAIRPFFLNTGSDGTTLKNLDIRGGGYEPIRIDGSPANITIQNIVCSNSAGDYWNYGIFINGNATNYVIRNYIMKNIQNGFEALRITGTATNLTIDSVNIDHGPGGGGMGVRIGGVSSNVSITNCYFDLDDQNTTDDGDYGVFFDSNVTGLTMNHDTLKTCELAGVYVGGTTTNFNIQNSIFQEGDGYGGGFGIHLVGVVNGFTLDNMLIDMNITTTIAPTADDADYGIYCNSNVSNVSLNHLTMHDAEVFGLYFAGTASTISILNSTFDNFNGWGGNRMIEFNSTVNNIIMTNVSINEDVTGTTDDGDYGLRFLGSVNMGTFNNVSIKEADVYGLHIWIDFRNVTWTGGTFMKNATGIRGDNCNYDRRNVKFQNMKIDSSTTWGIAIPICAGGLQDSVAILSDTITNSGSDGIYLWNGNVQTMYTIKNCLIAHNGRTSTIGDGIQITAPDNVVVTQNSIFDNAGYGINLHNSNGNCTFAGALAPIINSVTPNGGGSYTVNFTIPVANGAGTYKAEFFTNNPIAGIEGQYYVTSVSGLSAGINQTFTFTTNTGPAATPKTASLTMTFTRTGASCNGTSEFSNALALDPQGPGCVKSGILAWYRADKITGISNGQSVPTWIDYSGNTNLMKQFTLANEPTFNSTANLINFNPTLSLNGVQYLKSNNPIFNTGSASYTAYGAVNNNALSGVDYWLFDGNGGCNQTIGFAHNGNVFANINYCNDLNFAGPLANTTYLESYTRDGVSFVRNNIVNGKNVATNTVGGLNKVNGASVIGADLNGNQQWGGRIGEIVAYNRVLTATEQQKVNSYLSVKWGVSIDTTILKVAGAGNNIITGDGTVIWTANSTYYYRVTGIGRDDCDSLLQKQSLNQDVSSSGYVAMGLGSIAVSNQANSNVIGADKSFMLWGEDGKAGASSTTITGDGTITLMGGTCAQYSRLAKTFKVQETGTIGAVQVKFNMIGVKLGKTAADYYLAINSSGTFSGVITKLVAATSYDNVTGDLVFDNVNFTDGQFFTVVGKRVYGPANITNNLKVWLKAEDGISATDGNPVDIWADQGPLGNDVTQATANQQPIYYSASNLVNFNPSIKFDGSNDMLFKATGSLTNGTVYTGATVFLVNNSENSAAGQRIFRQAGTSDINLYAPYGNRTIWDAPYADRLDIGNSFFNNKAFNISTGVKDNSGTNTPAGTKQVIYNNGLSIGTGNGTGTYTGNNTSLSIGSNNVGSEFHNGYLGEVIYYSSALTPTERQKINSYLALKWGISLDQTTAINYLGADGSVIWDATTNATYKNRITGIGRDDCSDLNQRQSRNQDTTSAYVTMGLGTIAASNLANTGSFAADKNFEIWGDDGVAGASTTTVTGDGTITLNPSACGVFRRLGKTFKVQETGTVGNVQVSVNLRGVTLGKVASDFYLAINNTSTFSGVITKLISASSYSNGVVTFNNVDFTNGQFFTVIGQKAQGPANITSNLKIWLRAEDGITLNGNTVSSWTDQGPAANNVVQATTANQPTYNTTTNLINFNPSLSFNGTTNRLVATTNFFSAGNISYTSFGVVRNNALSGQDYWLWDGNGGCNSTLGFSHLNSVLSNVNGCNDLNIGTIAANTTYLESFTRDNVSFVRNNILNGLTVATNTSGGLNKVSVANGSTIGADLNGNQQWGGLIGEVIAFESVLTATEQRKINSYLAIKWGLSIDQTTPNDYLSAAGTTIWNATTYATYSHRITGIGRDDCSDLQQKQSKNQDAGSLVTISNGSSISTTNDLNSNTFSADNSWLLVGDNNKSINWTGSGVPINGGNVRLNRVWRVKETGTVGTVYLEVPDNTSALTDKLPSTTYSIYLLVANSGTNGKFSAMSGVTVQPMTFDGTNKKWYTTYNFADGDYFTFGSEKVCIAPAGISEGLNSWYHATNMNVGTIAANTAGALQDQAFGAYSLNRNPSGTATVVAGSATSFNYNRSIALTGNAAFTLGGLSNSDVIDVTAGTMYAVGTTNANLFALSSTGSNATGLGASASFNGTTSTYGAGVAGKPNVFGMLGSTTNVTGYTNGTAGIASGSIGSRSAGTYTLGFGQNGNNAAFNNGSISEGFSFNRVLAADEKDVLESYLAVKYGQTLSHNFYNGDYDGTNAAATTIYNISTYPNRVFGVGTDTTGCFYQKQSTSALTGSLLKMSINTSYAAENTGNTAQFTTDRSYVMAGDDNGAVGTWVVGGGANPNTPALYATTCEIPKRINRQWKVTGTYTTPAILFAIPDVTSSEATTLPAVTAGYSVWMVLNENTDFGVFALQEEVAMTLNPVTLNWEGSYTVAAGKTKYVTFVMKNNNIPTGSVSPTIMIAETDNSCTTNDGKVLSSAAALLTPTSGASYMWNTGAASATLSVNPVITTTYTVTVTAANGCTGSATTTVTVVSAPTAAIAETDNSCTINDHKIMVGDTATLTASGGVSYSWNDANTMSIRMVNPSVNTNYTVTVTDANGCTSTSTTSITIVTAPSVSLTGTNSICVGGSTGVSPTSGGTWVSSDASKATVTNAGVVTGVAAGSATFTFTSTSNGCMSAPTPSVTVNAIPAVSVTGSSNICIGSTTTLSPASGGTWVSSDPTRATVTNGGVVTGVSAGSVTFTFTNSTTGCVSAPTSAVTINSLPAVSITGSSTICAGSTTTLTPTVGGTWTSSDPTVASVTNGGLVTGLTAGTVTFTFTKTIAPNCSATTSAVTVNALTPVSIAGSNTICMGSTTTLSPSTGGTWTSSNNSVATVTNAGVVTGVSAGTATFTFTNTATGCASAATPPITVNALPSVSVTGASSICVGSTTALSPTTGGTWASSNPAVATVTNGGVVTGVTAGTATFTFTSTATGCTSLPTSAVSVTALPVVSIVGANSVCVGITTTLSPSSGGTWTSSDPSIATVTNGGVVTGVSAGTATFTFTSSMAPNCSATTAAVTVIALPVVSIAGAGTICVGTTTTLSPATGGTWASNSPGIATVTNAGVVTGVSAGPATFSFTLSATGCVSSPTPAVTVNALPVVSITGSSSICVGFTTALSPTSGGNWTSSDPSIATVTNSGVVTGISAGTVTFAFTSAITGCVSAPTGTVTVNALPVGSITGSTSICIGASTGLSPTSGGTWASSNNAVATVTNAGVVTGVSAGTATFTFTSTATGCTSSPTPAVTVNNTPAGTITGPASICIGSTTNLTPTTGIWTSNNPSVATVTNAGVVTGVSAGTATFTFTNIATGCQSSPTAPVTVNAPPVVSITGSSTICVGSTSALSPTTGGTWTSSDPTVATVTNAGVVTGISAGTVTFTFTNSITGCASAPTSAVTVNALPTVGISGPNSICVGFTTGLSPSTGGTWASSNAAVATVTNSGVVTGVSAGTATFTFTNTATGCVSVPTGSVIVSAIPVVSVTGPNSICVGSTTTLSPTTGGTWVSTNAGVASVTNAGVVTGVSAGTTTFIFTNTATGCVSAATSVVTINAIPVVSITGSNSLCVGATTGLSPSTGGTWASSNAAVATVTNAGVVTAVSAGTATFTFTNTTTGCVSAPTAAVTVNGTQPVSITGSTTICAGLTTTLSPTSGGTWVSNNPGVATVTNGGVVTGVSAGTATFTFTNTSTGCVSAPTAPVTVNALPVVSITGTNSICVGGITTLSPTTGGTWTSSNPAIATVTNAGFVSGVSPGTVNFTFTNAITGCVSGPTSPVTVNALPVVSITGANSFCVGSTTTLSPTTGGTWSSSNPSVATVTNAGVVTGVSAGTAMFTFTNTTTGCVSAATSAVTVNGIPVVNITGSSSICIGSTTALSPTTGGTWTSSDPTVATVTNAGVVTGVSAGTATFTFTKTSTGCVSAPTSAVTVNAPVSTSITGTNSICVGATTTLSPSVGGTWASSNAAVATVTNAGVVTGVSSGTATFTFTSSLTGCASTPTPAVTVNATPVVSITGTNNICVGFTTTLSPTSGGTWTSSNPAVATVTNGGVVLGVSAGTATFTFTNSGSGCTSLPTGTVTVNGLTVISLTGSANICVGSTTTLSPTTGGTWTSSNPAVATVTNGGVVTGMGAGTATFTFTSSGTGCTSLSSPTVTVTACNSLAAVKVFLSGPYDSGVDLMKDDLRLANLIPNAQPYGGSQYTDFNYTGTETIGAGVLNVTGNNAIVDWVLLELRSASSPGTVIARKAALVQRDGDVVESSDGVSPVVFVGTTAGSYYVVVRHRNHLGVMTASPVTLSGSTALPVNFTSAATANYQLPGSTGTTHAQQTLPNGKRGLWQGNMANGSGTGNQVRYQGTDADTDEPYYKVLLDPGNILVIPNYIVNAYDRADGNMDGMIIYQGSDSDSDIPFFEILSFPDNTLFLPNYVIYQQIP